MTDAAKPIAQGLKLRSLTSADLQNLLELDGRAFLELPPQDVLDQVIAPALELDRFTGVFDHNDIVGAAGIFSKSLTLPGGVRAPVAAVTWVSVQPGYTGQGILRRLMTDQLKTLHEKRSEPIALLTASESGIYGRFGYGLASLSAGRQIPQGLELRSIPQQGSVTHMKRDAALPAIRSLHQRIAEQTTGFLSRSEATWNYLFSDHQYFRDGQSNLEFVLHADGYVAFRTKGSFDARGPAGTLVIIELCAATPQAHAALWAHLLSYSLVREISYGRSSLDDPIQDLVVDPRAIRTTTRDHLWLRIVDLDRAIGLRSYSSAARVRVRVTDATCPWNDGTWELTLTAGPRSFGASSAVRTAKLAEIVLDISDLGAAFLGGARIARLAAAGRITGDHTAIADLDLAMSTASAPWCPEGF
ncbi:GNAT family N-acetyltransferase [Nakamurella antarctica]|nr:GNAT family N-acetyltransferase [Nakamurella antarctica]